MAVSRMHGKGMDGMKNRCKTIGADRVHRFSTSETKTVNSYIIARFTLILVLNRGGLNRMLVLHLFQKIYFERALKLTSTDGYKFLDVHPKSRISRST